MNKAIFKERIIITCTSEKELEAFKRYKIAKNDKKNWTFRFDIGKTNDVKIAITNYLK